VNKWDLVKDDGRGEAAVNELSDLLGCRPEEILRISAKTGLGVESVMDAVVARIPPPPPVQKDEKLRALAFDSWYDSFRGVVSLVAVFEGEVKKGALSLSLPSPPSCPQLIISRLFPIDLLLSPSSFPFLFSLQATRSLLPQLERPTPSSTSVPSPLAKSPSPNTPTPPGDDFERAWLGG
jgi:hypothetical protein